MELVGGKVVLSRPSKVGSGVFGLAVRVSKLPVETVKKLSPVIVGDLELVLGAEDIDAAEPAMEDAGKLDKGSERSVSSDGRVGIVPYVGYGMMLMASV